MRERIPTIRLARVFLGLHCIGACIYGAFILLGSVGLVREAVSEQHWQATFEGTGVGIFALLYGWGSISAWLSLGKLWRFAERLDEWADHLTTKPIADT